jgi:hypothetical protein
MSRVASDDAFHYKAFSGSQQNLKGSTSVGKFGAVVSPLNSGPPTPSADGDDGDTQKADSNRQALLWSFCAMVVIGLGNKIFQKLQTIPMYNYPNFLNLLTTFMYIPLSFAYVVPAIKKGWIREDNLAVVRLSASCFGSASIIHTPISSLPSPAKERLRCHGLP